MKFVIHFECKQKFIFSFNIFKKILFIKDYKKLRKFYNYRKSIQKK